MMNGDKDIDLEQYFRAERERDIGDTSPLMQRVLLDAKSTLPRVKHPVERPSLFEFLYARWQPASGLAACAIAGLMLGLSPAAAAFYDTDYDTAETEFEIGLNTLFDDYDI